MKLTIEGKMPSLNEVIDKTRLNRFAGATMKRNLQRDVSRQLKKQLMLLDMPMPLDCISDFKFIFTEENKKRDKDNIISSQKFLFDAMVEVGLLKNDGWRWVGNLSYEIKLGDKYSVEIEITEGNNG